MGLISKILSFTRITRNGANVSDVKANPGGGPNITMEHFAPPGDDSFPLDSDYAVSVAVPGSGRQAAVGYVDPLNTPQASVGDKRIYARGESGAPVVELWLHSDGTGRLENSAGSVTLAPDGTITSINAEASTVVGSDGTITLSNANGSTTISSDGTVTITGPVASFTVGAAGAITGANAGGSFGLSPTGDFLVNGAKISAAGAVTDISGRDLATHTHPQAADSNGDSQQNTGGPL